MEEHNEHTRGRRQQSQQEETVAKPARIRKRTRSSDPSYTDLQEDTRSHIPQQYSIGKSLPPAITPLTQNFSDQGIPEEHLQRIMSPTPHDPESQKPVNDFQVPLSAIRSFSRERELEDATTALYNMNPYRGKERSSGSITKTPSGPKYIFTYSPGETDSSHGSMEDLTSDMFASLAVAESSYFDKTDFVRQWQGLTKDASQEPQRPRIRDIFQAGIDFYSAIMSAVLQSDKEEEKVSLRRSYHLLREWGASYSVNKSRLDQLGDDAKEMVDTILSFLVEICMILVQRIYPLMGKWKSAQDETTRTVEEQAQSLMSLVQEVKQSDDDSETSDGSVSSNHSTNDTLQQCADELHEYVQLLNELHPSIEAFLPLAEEHAFIPEEDDSELSAPMIFSNLIRSKYDQAPITLVNSLGQLNFERYARMAEAREHNLAAVDEVAPAVEAEGKSTLFHDSGLGSSLPSVVAPSVTFTVAGKSRHKLPRLPTDAATKPFPCHFCGKTVFFTSQRIWEKHLLQDLLPYSCLELECSKSSEVFATRDMWIRHLEREHGVNAQSPPRLCPLCQTYTGSGKIEICKHYADHLEDIAIAASPLEVDEDDDASDDDSQDSDEYQAPVLEPIEEEEVGEHPNDLSGLSSEAVLQKAAPNCAICNAPAYPECPCEAERLQIAVKQAEERHMGPQLQAFRYSALQYAQRQVMNHFEQLREPLTSQYTVAVSATSDPIQVSEARAIYQSGINEAWRASTSRYPVLLEHYYSLCELDLPIIRDRHSTR